MNEEVFTSKKKELIIFGHQSILSGSISDQDRKSLLRLLELLENYRFENRLQMKGLLTHTLIDSLELDYSLGEKFIQFDNSIS